MDKGLWFFAIILVTTWDNTPYTTKKLNTLAIVTIGKSKNNTITMLMEEIRLTTWDVSENSSVDKPPKNQR